MTKQEFLRELRLALQGQMSQTAINENIRYYDNYIIEEVRKGSDEEAVVNRLGNPRLIAKTLIDTTDSFGRTTGEYYTGAYDREEYSRREHMDDSVNRKSKGLRLDSWYGKLIVITAAIVFLIVVANVIAFLLPLLVPVIIIFLIYSLYFGNKR